MLMVQACAERPEFRHAGLMTSSAKAEPRRLSGLAGCTPSRCLLAMLFIGVACSDLFGVFICCHD